MYYTIYKTTHTASSWTYIGKHQTKDLNDNYLGSGKLLLKAIENYGIESFRKEILYIFETEEEMNAKEAELVTEDFCSRPGNFNLCPGGKGGWGYINNSSAKKEYSKKGRLNANKVLLELYGVDNPFKMKDHGKKVSERNKIFHQNGVLKKSPNLTFKGRNHSEEWKISESERKKLQMKGSGNSQFGTMWITNGTENKKIKKTDSIPEGYRKGRK